MFPNADESVVISQEDCHIPRGTFEPRGSYSALHSTFHDQGMENSFLCEEWELEGAGGNRVASLE